MVIVKDGGTIPGTIRRSRHLSAEERREKCSEEVPWSDIDGGMYMGRIGWCATCAIDALSAKEGTQPICLLTKQGSNGGKAKRLEREA